MANKLPQMKTWMEPKQKQYPGVGKKPKSIEWEAKVVPQPEYLSYSYAEPSFFNTPFGQATGSKTYTNYVTATSFLQAYEMKLEMQKAYEEQFTAMFKYWLEKAYPKPFTSDSQVVAKMKEQHGLSMDAA